MKQIGGDHYERLVTEPFDVMKANFSKEELEGYFLGNILKYVMRYKHKNGVEDLKKASTYLDELIALTEV
jgi:hypothetical protein